MGGTVERELGIEDVCEIYSHCIHFSATVEQVTQNICNAWFPTDDITS
jgi:hypothetical protein